MARSYDSALRRAQAERTRTSLLDALEALLLEGPAGDATLPRVARRAGVTAVTAYRYFPTNDALMLAFIDHVRHRIGMDADALLAVAPERVHELAAINFESYEQNASILRAMMSVPSYERLRTSRKIDRPGKAAAAWRSSTRSASELRLSLGPLYLLVTPVAWRWLRDTWGLSAVEAQRAVAWAMKVLAEAIAPRPKKGSRHEDSSFHDPGPEPRARGERARGDRGRTRDAAPAPGGEHPRVRRRRGR